jgi:hypothetical protein
MLLFLAVFDALTCECLRLIDLWKSIRECSLCWALVRPRYVRPSAVALSAKCRCSLSQVPLLSQPSYVALSAKCRRSFAQGPLLSHPSVDDLSPKTHFRSFNTVFLRGIFLVCCSLSFEDSQRIAAGGCLTCCLFPDWLAV